MISGILSIMSIVSLIICDAKDCHWFVIVFLYFLSLLFQFCWMFGIEKKFVKWIKED